MSTAHRGNSALGGGILFRSLGFRALGLCMPFDSARSLFASGCRAMQKPFGIAEVRIDQRSCGRGQCAGCRVLPFPRSSLSIPNAGDVNTDLKLWHTSWSKIHELRRRSPKRLNPSLAISRFGPATSSLACLGSLEPCQAAGALEIPLHCPKRLQVGLA